MVMHKAYLMDNYPQLKEMLACVREIREVYQRKKMPPLYLFIEKYKNSNLKEIARFAKGLEKDLSAVENSVASPLSNGFCINRSKCTACTEKVYRLTGWVYRTAWVLSGKPSKGLPLRTCKEPVP